MKCPSALLLQRRSSQSLPFTYGGKSPYYQYRYSTAVRRNRKGSDSPEPQKYEYHATACSSPARRCSIPQACPMVAAMFMCLQAFLCASVVRELPQTWRLIHWTFRIQFLRLGHGVSDLAPGPTTSNHELLTRSWARLANFFRLGCRMAFSTQTLKLWERSTSTWSGSAAR